MQERMLLEAITQTQRGGRSVGVSRVCTRTQLEELRCELSRLVVPTLVERGRHTHNNE